MFFLVLILKFLVLSRKQKLSEHSQITPFHIVSMVKRFFIWVFYLFTYNFAEVITNVFFWF